MLISNTENVFQWFLSKPIWVVLKRILRGHVTIITISSSNHWQPPLIISHHFGKMSILIHLLTINYDTIAKKPIFSYWIKLHGTRNFVVIVPQNVRWNLPTLVTFTWMGKRCCVVLVVFLLFSSFYLYTRLSIFLAIFRRFMQDQVV